MAIQRLSAALINQIAAGEVIERPASALKELVENALDSGATEIDIDLRHAGQSFLSIRDNGAGIPHDELVLALERHATSKLGSQDLFRIQTFGFRGEALPAMAAVSRLTITSRPVSQEQAWSITVDGGAMGEPRPSRSPLGTCVEMADLFFATPARLKFLKSTRSEMIAIRQIMEQFALVYPDVSFRVMEEKRSLFTYTKATGATWEERMRARLHLILGEAFSQESLFLYAEHKNYMVQGFVGLPTDHIAQAQHQFFFVNGRPIKDKMLSSLIKIIYHDMLPHGRFPRVVLFLTVPFEYVDVNVHPAKTEVRFSESTFLKEWLLETLKRHLREKTLSTTQRLTTQTLQAFSSVSFSTPQKSLNELSSLVSSPHRFSQSHFSRGSQTPLPHIHSESVQKKSLELVSNAPSESHPFDALSSYPLGHAIGQIHHRYIVAQNPSGFLIIDQHAAHERIIYERLKHQACEHTPVSEALLIPTMLSLAEGDKELCEEVMPSFRKLGFDVAFWGDATLMIRAIPSLLKQEGWEELIQDLLVSVRCAYQEEIAQDDLLTRALNVVFSRQACQHRSIKSGRKLSLMEMDALLREMEKTPSAAQCNHGRPTYITLDMSQLDGLFKRHG